MRIILPSLPDPTDIVIQGEMWGLDGGRKCSCMEAVTVQGEVATAAMKGFPAPRAMIGQHEWYGLLPRKLGPKVYSGGEVRFEDVGSFEVSEVVEPITSWINQNITQQSCGYSALCPDIIGPAEATNTFVVGADDPLDDIDKIQLPRKAIVMTGMNGRRVFPKMPESYYQREVVNATMVQGTQQFRLSGQTLDSTGAALGNCRVVLFDSSRVIAGGDINPVVAETISDGSGNYSFIVPRPVDYQLIAYLPGSPDVAGITRDDVFPVVV